MNLVMMPMWVLSGVFFSAANFPGVVQPFIQALPLTATIDAFRGDDAPGIRVGGGAPGAGDHRGVGGGVVLPGTAAVPLALKAGYAPPPYRGSEVVLLLAINDIDDDEPYASAALPIGAPPRLESDEPEVGGAPPELSDATTVLPFTITVNLPPSIVILL